MLMLRDVIESDLPIFFEHQQEPEANEMAAFPAREREAFMTHWRTKILGGSGNRATAIVVDGCVVGNILSWNQDDMRLVGYWIGRAHWGKGFASSALSELVAKYETSRPLHAFVAVKNVASIRVLEKCGFRRRGAPDHDELLMVLDASA